MTNWRSEKDSKLSTLARLVAAGSLDNPTSSNVRREEHPVKGSRLGWFIGADAGRKKLLLRQNDSKKRLPPNPESASIMVREARGGDIFERADVHFARLSAIVQAYDFRRSGVYPTVILIDLRLEIWIAHILLIHMKA